MLAAAVAAIIIWGVGSLAHKVKHLGHSIACHIELGHGCEKK